MDAEAHQGSDQIPVHLQKQVFTNGHPTNLILVGEIHGVFGTEK